MEVLMYGWEYPPKNTGGLGIACKGIIEGLIKSGTAVNLVLPENNTKGLPSFCVDITKHLSKEELKKVPLAIMQSSAYSSNKEYVDKLNKFGLTFDKSNNLIEDAYRYGEITSKLALKLNHDVIHVHDWLTIPAGIKAKKLSKRPLIVHIHSTEFDRSGGNPNPEVYKIEKAGCDEADMIIAVSNFTKKKIMNHYGIPEEKIKVVHNAINKEINERYNPSPLKKKNKIVLFLGRITIQKGPDYFISMANKVLKKVDNVKFVMAGSGDMTQEIISKAIELGIDKQILFTGFLKGKDVDRAFQDADVYVMPSISEPFGLTALESIKNGTPVIISKQSGVNEVLANALKVDFWDVDKMANQVISILKYPALQKSLKQNSQNELNNFSWLDIGKKLNNLYTSLIKSYATA